MLCTIMPLGGCSKPLLYAPQQTDKGHGQVELSGPLCDNYGLGELKWGDGTQELVIGNQFNIPHHTYTYNGSYELRLTCGGWSTGDHATYYSQANVNTALEKPRLWGLSGAGLSGMAALITSVVGLLTFVAGRKSAK